MFEQSDAVELFWKIERLRAGRSKAREASSKESITIKIAAAIKSSHFPIDRNRAANSSLAAAIIKFPPCRQTIAQVRICPYVARCPIVRREQLLHNTVQPLSEGPLSRPLLCIRNAQNGIFVDR